MKKLKVFIFHPILIEVFILMDYWWITTNCYFISKKGLKFRMDCVEYFR